VAESESCLFIAALIFQVNAGNENVKIASVYGAKTADLAGCSPLRITPVAAARDRSYLNGWFHPGNSKMPAIVSTARLPRPLLLLALVGGLLMAATLALWTYYGTAVFLEVVRAGWAACF